MIKKKQYKNLKEVLKIKGNLISHNELVDKLIHYITDGEVRSVKSYKEQLLLEGVKIEAREINYHV